MRLCVLLAVWKRHDLAALALDHLARVREELAPEGIEISGLIVGSEGAESAGIVAARSFGYVEHENAPLGAKWNAGMQLLGEASKQPWGRCDGVVIQGSDDFLAADVFRFAARSLAAGMHLGGFRDLHYVARGPRAIYWPGYGPGNQELRAGEPIGCGRFISAALLARVGWRPWPDDAQRGLDLAAWNRLRPLVRDEDVAVTTMAESGRMIDVKAHEGLDMSRFDAYVPQSVEVPWVAVAAHVPPATAAAIAAYLDPTPRERLFEPHPAPLISAAMIVRDEESRIERCLRSLIGIVDEVACVDTGSVDRTREYCELMGARVFKAPWRDDFSAARNVSLKAARGRWRLVIDADEWVSDPGDLRDFLTSRPDVDAALLDVTIRGGTVVHHATPRVLGPDCWYEYPVHNVVRGYKRLATPTAAIETSNVGREGAKCERSLRLLHRMLDDPRWPGHPHAPYYLAQTYATLGKWADCERWAEECLRRAPDAVEYALAWLLLAQAKLTLAGGDPGVQVADEVLGRGLAKHPGLCDLRWFRIALDSARCYGSAMHPGPYAYVAQSSLGPAMRLPEFARAVGLPVRFGRGAA